MSTKTLANTTDWEITQIRRMVEARVRASGVDIQDFYDRTSRGEHITGVRRRICRHLLSEGMSQNLVAKIIRRSSQTVMFMAMDEEELKAIHKSRWISITSHPDRLEHRRKYQRDYERRRRMEAGEADIYT